MARRPRSHQLEDRSVREFEAALPEAWTSRQVVPDYGVDREVEIFTAEGEQTGLKFAVQLKATDDQKKAEKVVLKVALLDYLLEYDLPALIFRYDSTTGIKRWSWARSVSARASLRHGQKTFTHHFDLRDEWSSDTPAAIESFLVTRRELSRFPQTSPIPIRIVIEPGAAAISYVGERAVHRVVAASRGMLIMASTDARPLELTIYMRTDFVSLGFDKVVGLTMDVTTNDGDELTSALLYGMVNVFGRARLTAHARAIGRAILDAGHVVGVAQLALSAMAAFPDDPAGQVDLAIRNGLESVDTPFYPIALASLIKAGGREGSISAPERFLRAALERVGGTSIQSASIHYSLGNLLRSAQPLVALSHYNLARRLRRSYNEAAYFTDELGSLLYNVRRFACAVIAYNRAVELRDAPTLRLHLGDALLHVGHLGRAREQYEHASHQGDPAVAVEANFKMAVCSALIETYGEICPVNWSNPMQDIPEDADGPTAWKAHLATVNALDPTANFNLGLVEAACGNYDAALVHFAICAIVQPRDAAAWSSAIIAAINLRHADLMATLMQLSINLSGLDGYDHLRSSLVAQGASADLLTMMDEGVVAAHRASAAQDRRLLTLRMLGEENAADNDGPGSIDIDIR